MVRKRNKNASFVAIGVGQGDAFFLEKAGRNVVVDGGLSAFGFPELFKQSTKRSNIDILVCTHNDADHANGIIGFLKSGLDCKEVWLPASWSDRLEDLLTKPNQFIEELISDINKLDIKSEHPMMLQDIENKYAENLFKSEERSKEISSIEFITNIMDKHIESEQGDNDYWINGYSQFYPRRVLLPSHMLFLLSDEKKHLLFLEAISAASRIRDIATEAYHRGALIRWFDFNTTIREGGYSEFLVPLNSSEAIEMRFGKLSAICYLALTKSNKQSLVFISPDNEYGPSVLFSADSDLSFSTPISWTNGMIITAPHHGSDSNAKAYDRITNEMVSDSEIFWVRSDGCFRSRPGKSYINVNGRRFCTICRDRKHPKQNIKFIARSKQWRPHLARKCSCI